MEFVLSSLLIDNGGIPTFASNFPRRGYKGSLMDGGTRNLAFVSGPLIPRKIRGTVSNELMHCSDWFPTLLHLAEVSTEGMELYGVDQWRTIR